MTQPRRRSALLSELRQPDSPATGPDVLRELRRVIISGRIAPDSTVPIDDVAALFGLSRIPVREALKTLIGEGLITHQPRFGFLVTRLSEAELHELYVVRGSLESAALEPAVSHATEADDARAQQVHEALTSAVDHQDSPGFQRTSRQFHLALLRPCRMPRLLGMLETAWNLTEPAQTMTRVDAQTQQALRDDHSRMLTAFVARDAAALRSIGELHHRRLTDALDTLSPSEIPPEDADPDLDLT